MNLEENNNSDSTNSSEKQWFDNVGSPMPEAPRPSDGQSKRRIIIAAAILIVLLGIAILASFLMPHQNVAKDCFNRANYKGLYTIVSQESADDISLSDVQPQKVLYAHEVYFIDGTTDYNTDFATDPTPFLKRIGAFYKEHHLTAPIAISLDTRYTEGSSKDVADKRLAKLRDLLIDSGVATSAITMNAPVRTHLDEDSLGDDLDEGMPVFVKITPSSHTCNER